MEQVELAPGRGREGWNKADSAPEQMLLVAEAAQPWNNELNLGTTGLCTWEGLRNPELGFLLLLLLPNPSAFLAKITGGTVQTRA